METVKNVYAYLYEKQKVLSTKQKVYISGITACSVLGTFFSKFIF